MATLSDVTKTLQNQNAILEDVSGSINNMLREQMAERLLSERQRLAQREKDIEAKNRSTSSSAQSKSKSPGGIKDGVRQGLLEGLGIQGLVGGLGSMLSSMLGGVGFGSIAALGAKSLTKLLTRGAFIGLLAAYGEEIFTGLINSLDPEGVYLDKDSQKKFASSLNFGVMGGLLARSIGGLFGKRFKALFGVAGLVGGMLYPYFESAIDDTKLESAFNDAFQTDFGSEIIAGIGAVISGVFATILSSKIIKLVKKVLGLTPKDVPDLSGRGGPTPPVGEIPTKGGKPAGSGAKPKPSADAAKVKGLTPQELNRIGFDRTPKGRIIDAGSKKFASISDVMAAADSANAARIAKAAKYLKVLGVIGLGAEALMIANMIYQGKSDGEVLVALSGLIGAAGVGYVGGALGAAGGTMLLPGWGTLGGGLIGGIAGAVGGDWAAESLARMILGIEKAAPLPSNFKNTGGRLIQNERDENIVMSQPLRSMSEIELSTINPAAPGMMARSRAAIAAENERLRLLKESEAGGSRAPVVIDNSTTDNSTTMMGNGAQGAGSDYRASGMDPIDYRYARQYLGVRGYGPNTWNTFAR